MSIQENPHPKPVPISRIALHCGRSVIDDVRHGRLSIRAADMLAHLIEHGKLKTGAVASLVGYGFRVYTPRSHSMNIRGILLKLAARGLLVEDKTGITASWMATPNATA